MKKALLPVFLTVASITFVPSTALALTEAEAQTIYQSMIEGGATAEEIILALIDAGMSLEEATAFAIANADKVGFATALAHAGVCLAGDEWVAADVAEAAIDAATAQAKNAVEARASESVKNYGTGGCQGLENNKKGGIPPFGKPPKSGGGVSTDQ